MQKLPAGHRFLINVNIAVSLQQYTMFKLICLIEVLFFIKFRRLSEKLASGQHPVHDAQINQARASSKTCLKCRRWTYSLCASRFPSRKS
jgi:hypothetical protein